MKEFRKSNQRNTTHLYACRPILRVSNTKQKSFIMSKIIADKLEIDTAKHGVMFGLKNKKIYIKREDKAKDNYHLGNGETSTFRFRSTELHNYISDFFKKNNEEFYLEMKDDFSFELVKYK